MPQEHTPFKIGGGDWTLHFQPGRGGPAARVSSDLTAWNLSRDPAIRYFSGTGTYSRTLRLTGVQAAGPLLLELVADLASVSVNGHPAGITWTRFYRVNVTGLFHPGDNAIAITVANLWANRLIGDAQPGAAPIAHTTGPTYIADAPLHTSGLLGRYD